jgi:drug/metabolite transporter (DMT)-like permease
MDKSGGVWRMTAAMALSGTIGACVLWSGQAPMTVVLVRCLIGSAVLLGIVWWRGSWVAPGRRALLWIGAGAAAIIGNWLCLFSAFTLCGISIATVVYHMQPFLLVLLAVLLQGERPEARKVWLMVPAFIGVALTTGLDSSAGNGDLLAGVALALAAAFLYAIATLATRKLGGYPPAQIAGLQLLAGVVALAPGSDIAWNTIAPAAWGSLLVIGLVHTGLVYNLMYGAFQRLPADAIASLSFIYPLVAVATDIALFNAAMSPLQWVGMLLILLSLAGSQARVGIRTRPGPSGSAYK